MKINIKKSKLKGIVKAPPSKSASHRALICAALCDGESVITNMNYSEDVLATLDCIIAIGAKVRREKNKVVINGIGINKKSEEILFNCRESGSTLRFFIPISWYLDTASVFNCSHKLLTRSLKEYEKLKNNGVSLTKDSGYIKTKGMLRPGKFFINGNISSQFISGLLFVLPLLDGDSEIILSDLTSASYVDMTIEMQKMFGVSCVVKNNTIYIKGNQKYHSANVAIEGDFSNAVFFEALNRLNNEIKIENLNINSVQGDKAFFELFDLIDSGFCEIDLKNNPDLAPIMFAIAGCKNGARFINTDRLRHKESNRVEELLEQLSKFGIKYTVEKNAVVIKKSKIKSPTIDVNSCNDHRIVMTLSVLATKVGATINNAEAVRKSFPSFFKILKELGADIS